ncbi:fatty acid hydroxylase [Aspergillus sclerotioniger CBS 115572]|uniref:Bifunctional cytochrome P450/NADPH--P450 reductase n=1 Tax=Aspergillus sclerotioniger CBS 115572 TaxID=1450535 RepID=A0A317WN92_9EURO|nr:fatty acid hydroxylase [Aspergillus sclerotioniger CBS 115572]PWY87956.1 fatty acid hydroxylase [Aspergillus sclerotioniger CBS 115572]
MSDVQPVPIPGPKGVPFLGNIYDIEQEVPMRSFELLVDQYGPIFRLNTFGVPKVFVSNQELANEVCNEERFSKSVDGGLDQVRHLTHDGLFTARYPGEENWALAHRILIPAFGPLSIRAMYDEMYDIATQLAMKWARQGPETPINVTDDFTRLTLDSIALCSMGTRFNSFYHDTMHPFVEAMVGTLQVASYRSQRPALLNQLPTSENNSFWNDIAYLRKLAKEMAEDRRKNPSDKKDLLNALVLGRDSQTGKGLSEDSIIDNMITFLIAGHETTSGMLSFVFYFLLKNAHAYKKAQEEVDRVIGRRKITVDDLSKLPYINAVMRESLRLRPTAGIIKLHAHPIKNTEDPVTLANGKYVLNKGESVSILLSKLHRDPKVYGSDAEEFKPERMLDENFNKLPPNSWKPFGNGMRGCIGRPFAWQEGLLAIALLLQNFNFQLDDPSYDLRIKQTLTIKPLDFKMRATPRHGLDPIALEVALNSGDVPRETTVPSRDRKKGATIPAGGLKPMHIFFGSNTGTCEAFARRMADDAATWGFAAEVKSLDSATENVPKEDPVVFIAASYEGQPADNAAHFFEWLSAVKNNEFEGVNYAVFGCGHHDWNATFYRIPKAINELVSEHGGNRLCDIGLVDTANSDMFTDFDNWSETALWPSIASKFGSVQADKKASSGLQVEVSSERRVSNLGLQLQEGYVIENELLTAPDVPAKRLVRFKLPTDMTYQCGDYLAVLPVNPTTVVRRAMRRFNLPWDAVLTVRKPSQTQAGPWTIPLDNSMSAFGLLSSYVELSQPASKRDLIALADAAVIDEEAQAELRYTANSPSRFAAEIVTKRLSLLDILDRHAPAHARTPILHLIFPLTDPTECSITVSVLNAPSLSGTEEAYMGVASTYLSVLQPGEHTHIAVRPSHSGFKPPTDLTTPMIMASAGSGLGPFRGFIMDRAEKILGRSESIAEQPAKAILYAGCRTKGKDDIHAAELEEWSRQGIVDVRWAYSRPSDGSAPQHIQDRIASDCDELVSLFEQGARIYVCGSTDVGNAVGGAFKNIFLNARKKHREEALAKGQKDVPPEGNDEEARKFFDGLKANMRYATDVFT